jgi:sec-independent protein translocase protein TatA
MSPTSYPVAALFGLGGSELLIILLIILLLFGGAKLPQLAKGLGESIREFKKASKDEPEEKKPAEKKPGNGAGNN